MSTTNIKYHPNPLSAYENGAIMDLRFRLAVELLKSGAVKIEDCNSDQNERAARAALNTVMALFEQGEALGLVEDMPDHGDIPRDLKHHIERNVRAQIYQNETAQKAQMEAQHGKIMQAPPGLVMPN